jgi:hypothetical protein
MAAIEPEEETELADASPEADETFQQIVAAVVEHIEETQVITGRKEFLGNLLDQCLAGIGVLIHPDPKRANTEGRQSWSLEEVPEAASTELTDLLTDMASTARWCLKEIRQ